MLGVKSYAREYVGSCRKRDSDVASYKKLAVKAGADKQAASALAAFEPAFFNNMVLVLDAMFVHRLRNVEGKDGNPLNEVRVICTSLLEHDGVMTPDKTMKLSPDSSVLGLAPGQEIRIDQAAFARLAGAFFAEIERRYA